MPGFRCSPACCQQSERDDQRRGRLKAVAAIASIALTGLGFVTGMLWIFLISLTGLMGLLGLGHDRSPLIRPDQLR